MIFFLHLRGDNSSGAIQPGRMWRPVENTMGRTPGGAYAATLWNGTVAVQRGWYFSSHELWKLLVLPYLDDPLVRRVTANGERAQPTVLPCLLAAWAFTFRARAGPEAAAQTRGPSWRTLGRGPCRTIRSR